eukprot:1187827-Prorocentrum_minimum.AAC.4
MHSGPVLARKRLGYGMFSNKPGVVGSADSEAERLLKCRPLKPGRHLPVAHAAQPFHIVVALHLAARMPCLCQLGSSERAPRVTCSRHSHHDHGSSEKGRSPGY